MRLAIVDLGTLSLRFDVYDAVPGGVPQLVNRYRSMPRLGDGLFDAGRIDKQAVERVLNEFRTVRAEADRLKVERVYCVGTSALRDAANGTALVESVRESTGIVIRVLSGDEEARLTALGIFSNETALADSAALVDIGGGSTEISFVKDRQVERSMSIDLGALRIKEKFLRARDPKTGLYSPAAIKKARQFIRNGLAGFTAAAASRRIEQLVGSSGTIRTLERLHLPHPKDSRLIARMAVVDFAEKFARLKRDEALALPGMEENRVDVLYPGLLILVEVLSILGADSILVTFFSLRHGVLAEAMGEL